MFAVGEIESYHELASPLDLNHLNIYDIKSVSNKIKEIYPQRIYPDQIDISLDSELLRADNIFPQNKVIKLPKIDNIS